MTFLLFVFPAHWRVADCTAPADDVVCVDALDAVMGVKDIFDFDFVRPLGFGRNGAVFEVGLVFRSGWSHRASWRVWRLPHAVRMILGSRTVAW